jgi:hypothetical protein
MWEPLQQLILSKSPWSGLFFLIVGACLGALMSIYFTFRSQRPRLIISGGGGGGNGHRQRWNVSIANRPSFLGVRFAGETARDLHAWIRLKKREKSHYPLAWSGQQHGQGISIEAGQSQHVELFSWFADKRGSYFVVDQADEPAAKFDGPEQEFVLRINDRLGRSTEFKFRVRFDDSHLKQPPQLQIIHPLSLEVRMRMLKSGFRQLMRAVLPPAR